MTIINYHYVRDTCETDFPGLKSLSCKEFSSQLDGLSRRYHVITMQELLAAMDDPTLDFPNDACLLTFDDGYIDHIANVLPLLLAKGWQGTFFPSARPALVRKALDINKIQFILAARAEETKIVTRICDLVNSTEENSGKKSVDDYWNQFGLKGRFDSPKTMFIKRMLEYGLPSEIRNPLLDDLFREYVTQDELGFVEQQYMDAHHLQTLVNEDMYIGNHGSDHLRLGVHPLDSQISEIKGGIDLLNTIGIDTEKGWVMAYPYGSYNLDVKDIVTKSGCKIAFTIEPLIADLGSLDRMAVPRLDTKDVTVQDDNSLS